MAATAFKLWCLIEEGTNPCLVTVSSGVYISELKEMIKENMKIDHPAPRLNLWKVHCF